MEKKFFSSPDVAKEMGRLFGSQNKDVKIELRHADEIRVYVAKIEEGNKKASVSQVPFR